MFYKQHIMPSQPISFQYQITSRPRQLIQMEKDKLLEIFSKPFLDLLTFLTGIQILLLQSSSCQDHEASEKFYKKLESYGKQELFEILPKTLTRRSIFQFVRGNLVDEGAQMICDYYGIVLSRFDPSMVENMRQLWKKLTKVLDKLSNVKKIILEAIKTDGASYEGNFLKINKLYKIWDVKPEEYFTDEIVENKRELTQKEKKNQKGKTNKQKKKGEKGQNNEQSDRDIEAFYNENLQKFIDMQGTKCAHCTKRKKGIEEILDKEEQENQMFDEEVEVESEKQFDDIGLSECDFVFNKIIRKTESLSLVEQRVVIEVSQGMLNKYARLKYRIANQARQQEKMDNVEEENIQGDIAN